MSEQKFCPGFLRDILIQAALERDEVCVIDGKDRTVKINFDVTDKIVSVNLIGELDTPATEEIQNQVNKILQHADKEIIIDCSRLKYIASSGLRQLITIYKKCKGEGGHMVLKGVTSDVMEVFEDTSFNRIFDFV